MIKSTSLSLRMRLLSEVDTEILYFFARVVLVNPEALEMNLRFALVFFKHGKIIADVKLPAPIMPTIPLLEEN
jgi:hypothetical protein